MNADLVDRIGTEIRNNGKISFAGFMEMALYDSDGGYYNAERDPIGRSGDYETSPQVHALFGKLLGRQLAAMLRTVRDSPPPALIEIGAGPGILMRDVLGEIRREDPGLFSRVRCAIVERSPAMRARQERIFAAAGLDRKIAWSDRLRDVAPPGEICGCIFSNELVDAFPVHRVVMTDEGLREVYVCLENGRLAETLDVPSTPRIVSHFDGLGISLLPGQAAEVNLAAVDWMREVGVVLGEGFVVTIDYGHTAEDLYSTRRRKGTLLCYSSHSVSEDPYQDVGRQDITAHVDFTTLAMSGQEAGLKVTGFTDQAHFLISLGAAEDMEGMDPETGGFQAMKRLISDTRMGKTFKILIQHKGLSPPELRGLAYRPFFKDALFR